MINLAAKQIDAARRIVEHLALHLQAQLSVKLWDGSIVPLGPDATSEVVIAVRSPAAVRRLILSPRLRTVFELYAAGDVDIEGGTPLEAANRWDHLKALHLARNVDRKQILKLVWPFLLSSRRSLQRIRANYEGKVGNRFGEDRQDQPMVQFHYDLSNEFYELFLDREMLYSSAYFPRPDMTIDEAQQAHLEISCRRLQLKPGDRLLDIGCGWGGLSFYAVQNYGVTAHGVTLAQRQYDYARAKIERLGLGDRMTVELRDHRTLEGEACYDKIAQIEMFEHLGIDNHDEHFALMHRLLRPRGLYLHQAFTRMATRDLKKFRKKTAYQKVMTRFIFPGGELDYIGMTVTNLERHGFEVHDVEGWREHYRLTLIHWLNRLYANREAAEREVGAAKTRLWLLYFTLFAKAFERNTTSVFQTLASKRHAGLAGLPLSREHLTAAPSVPVSQAGERLVAE